MTKSDSKKEQLSRVCQHNGYTTNKKLFLKQQLRQIFPSLMNSRRTARTVLNLGPTAEPENKYFFKYCYRNYFYFLSSLVSIFVLPVSAQQPDW